MQKSNEMSNPFNWSCSMTLQKLPCRALLYTRKCGEYQKRHKKAARKVDSPRVLLATVPCISSLMSCGLLRDRFRMTRKGSGAMGYVSTPSKGVLLSKRGSCWSSSGRKINTQHDYGCTPLMVAASIFWLGRSTSAASSAPTLHGKLALVPHRDPG